MTDRLTEEYFNWLRRFICDRRYLGRKSYRKLSRLLFDTEFFYKIDLDENRLKDGLELRERFANECGFQYPVIEQPCSVLEMMAALAIRCEEHIMDNPDIGNRTGKWFFDMLKNLGLDGMTDENFDSQYAKGVLNRFLNRKYKRNGEGSLFPVRHGRVDMRSVEIWYQAMWYLDNTLKE